MQLINYHTSCSRNLFLKDRYGSTQVASWINEEQGLVDCITQIIYNYDIRNTGTVDATLCSLIATITPPGVTLDLTADIADQVVGPGRNFTIWLFLPRLTLLLEPSTLWRPLLLERILLEKSVQIWTLCSSRRELRCLVLPPTPAPPTSSPAPTPDPQGQDCMIDADAACVLGNLAPCSLLSSLPPAFYNCSIPNIIDLGFIFTGGTCADSDNHSRRLFSYLRRPCTN